jgi:hypothetical protein
MFECSDGFGLGVEDAAATGDEERGIGHFGGNRRGGTGGQSTTYSADAFSFKLTVSPGLPRHRRKHHDGR